MNSWVQYSIGMAGVCVAVTGWVVYLESSHEHSHHVDERAYKKVSAVLSKTDVFGNLTFLPFCQIGALLISNLIPDEREREDALAPWQKRLSAWRDTRDGWPIARVVFRLRRL